jgi:hypothetical protein
LGALPIASVEATANASPIYLEQCQRHDRDGQIQGIALVFDHGWSVVCVCLTRRLVGWVAMMEKAGCDKEPSAGVRVGSGSRQLCAHSGPTRQRGMCRADGRLSEGQKVKGVEACDSVG